MKRLIILIILLIPMSGFSQENLFNYLEMLQPNEQLTNSEVFKLLGYDTTNFESINLRFKLGEKFTNSDNSIKFFFLISDNAVGHNVYVYSINSMGEILDYKSICNSDDSDNLYGDYTYYKYDFKDSTIVINYTVRTANGPTLDHNNYSYCVHAFQRYVPINENGFFFEFSNNEFNPNKRRYPIASNELIDYDLLYSMTTDEIAIMRNEIFAAYGYKFKSQRFSAYFDSQTWTTQDKSNVESDLSEIERSNIETIQKFEDK